MLRLKPASEITKGKPLVSIKDLQPEMVFGSILVEQVYKHFDLVAVITSGTEGYDGDGEHKDGSLHYTGYALDFRKRTVPKAYRGIFLEQLREVLGHEFDVVDSGPCYHVEFDPKGVI